MFPEMSKQCTLVDSPSIVFEESATSVAANHQYQGRCTVCVELIHEKRLISDRRFVLMENCCDIICLQCTKLLKLQRMDQILCPVCGTGSKGFVDLDRSVCSVDEKRKLFSNQTNVTSLIQIKILTDFKVLRCQLCSLEVQSNPANPGGQFAITTSCFCVICASCITKKQRRLKKCPVCNQPSNRIKNHSQFIRLERKKQVFFNKTPKRRHFQRLRSNTVNLSSSLQPTNNLSPCLTPSFQNSNHRCQLCSLEVRNNPTNPGGLFGILQKCRCIFCASCIEAKHSKDNRACPICSTISKRLLNYSEFVSLGPEKEKLFIEKAKNPGLRCQLCWQVIRNIGNHLFGILENCQCVFCAGCIDEQRRIKLECPICEIFSKIILYQLEFPSSSKEKLYIIASLKQNLLPTLQQLEQLGISQSMSRSTATSCQNSLPLSTNVRKISWTISPNFKPKSIVPTLSTLQCQLCLLEVQNNPANPDRLFGILRNCLCIFCATCIEPKHSKRDNVCPICSTISNKLLKHSVFVTLEYEKRSLFIPKPKPKTKVQNCSGKCQLCLLEIRKNPANPGGQFGILQNCNCLLCASCIAKKRITSLRCPICDVESLCFILQKKFVQISKTRLLLKTIKT